MIINKPSSLMEEVLSAYNLSQDDFEVTPFGNGLINTTWRIKNSHDDFILQKINRSIFKNPTAIASNISKLADYLSINYPGYLFVRSIKTKKNDELAYVNDEGYFRLCKYVKQSHTINIVEKPEQAYEAAKKFGEFTKILSGFPIDNLQVALPDFHNLSLRYKQFSEALKTGNKERILQSKELIEIIIANKDIVETYKSILQDSSFKLRVTHHDTKISNVLFDDNNKGLCVIDLDTVMAGYFISDVGDMIRTYLSPVNEEEKDFSKIEIREDYFSAIVKGYLSGMNDELSSVEKDHFIYSGKFMIYMQAIRFFTDHLNNDIYYGAKYEDHNYVRAGNQVALLQLLFEKENRLKEILSSTKF